MSDAALISLIAGGALFAIAMGLLLWWDAKKPSSFPRIRDPALKQIWSERAQKDSADYGLAGTRAVAGKWAASAAALLGVLSTVAVVAGPSELADEVGGSEAIVAAAMVLAAGVVAALATLLAALAEQGTPVTVANDNPDRYKEVIRSRADRAATELLWSRILTVVAVALVLGAAGVAWLTALTGPSDDSGQSALVIGSDGSHCGTLAEASDRVVLTVGTGPPKTIPPDAKVTLVDSCP